MANPTVTMKTNHGTIEAEMFADVAPKTAGNFIELAKKGFYDGVIFHRVIDGFMIQGGDPTGTGRGGPGYQIDDEFAPGLAHTHAGIFSMANAGPNSGGSQFFITLAATPWLDGKHAIFGKVTAGLDIVKAIGKLQTGPGDRPVKDVVMEKVTVSEHRRGALTRDREYVVGLHRAPRGIVGEPLGGDHEGGRVLCGASAGEVLGNGTVQFPLDQVE
jgi:cyclophilin family peptidyl-prolyl cis-trans isomerase